MGRPVAVVAKTDDAIPIEISVEASGGAIVSLNVMSPLNVCTTSRFTMQVVVVKGVRLSGLYRDDQ